MIPGFTSRHVETTRGAMFVAHGGAGSPVLLLHGFPETHFMWRDIAPTLSAGFSVICADPPGYGRSSCPPSDEQHVPYSKRAMAEGLVEMMSALGHEKFVVIGHDRGGRVAYRMAIDHPTVVSRLIRATCALRAGSKRVLNFSFPTGRCGAKSQSPANGKNLAKCLFDRFCTFGQVRNLLKRGEKGSSGRTRTYNPPVNSRIESLLPCFAGLCFKLLPCAFALKTNEFTSCFYLPHLALSCF
jgi:pimeloyl-ACP methyl ester carboxylesterase